MSKISKPPKFLPGADYRAWKNKVEMWLGVSKTIAKEDQAPMIRMHCFEDHPTADAAVEHLTYDQLKVEDGLKVLLDKLDENFIEDAIDEMFGAIRAVFEFKRSSQQTVADYIVAFEQHWDKMKARCRSSEDIVVCDEMKGSFLLYNGNLDLNDINIILASVKSLKYCDMKSTLKRDFNKQNPGGKIDALDKGNEEAFYTNRRKFYQHTGRSSQYPDVRKFSPSYSYSSRGKHSNQEGHSSRYKSYRPQIKSVVKKMKPMQRNGKRSVCIICRSGDH